MLGADRCPHLEAFRVRELDDRYRGTEAYWCATCQRHFDLPAYGLISRVRRRLARALWVE